MKNFRKMLYMKIAKFHKDNNKMPVPSIISYGTKIKGDILGGDVIHIDGRLEGNISCEELVIGIKGQVFGQIRVKSLSLYGTLQGTAEAENLFIASTARLTGDALHNSIAIEPGAYVEGRYVRIQSLQKRATVSEKDEKEPVARKTATTEKTPATVNASSTLFKTASSGK